MQRMIETVPQNVPQRCANQAMHARYAQHACIFLVSGFVSVENKERCIYLPKLVIRVRFPSPAPFSSRILKLKFQKLETVPQTSRKFSLHKCQPPGMTLARDLEVLNRPLYQVSPKTITQYLRDWLAVKVSYIQVDSKCNHVISPTESNPLSR